MRAKYSELLRDPRWQKKRLQALERDQWSCCICSCDNKELHVHHTYYAKGKKPWEYPASDLISLCSECHSEVHCVMEAIGACRPYHDHGNEVQVGQVVFLKSVEQRHNPRDYDPVYRCFTYDRKEVMLDSNASLMRMFESEDLLHRYKVSVELKLEDIEDF